VKWSGDSSIIEVTKKGTINSRLITIAANSNTKNVNGQKEGVVSEFIIIPLSYGLQGYNRKTGGVLQ
jgi:hypothetical protein